MSSKFTENVEAQIVGTIIGGAILLSPAAIFAGAAPLLTAALGEWATYLAELLLGAATLLFSVVAGHYYFFVLPSGKDPAGSVERKHYDDLRNDLARGGTAARIYADGLTKTLSAVEEFFGDTGKTMRPLVANAFGLQQARPLWTAPAFDRCILLTLIYPIVTIFFVWVISGHVGVAEAALAFPPNNPWWQRGACFLAVVICAVSYLGFRRCKRWERSIVWFLFLAISALGVSFLVAPAPDDAGAVAGSVSFSSAFVGGFLGDAAVAGIVATAGVVIGTLVFSFGGAIAGAAGAALTVILIGTYLGTVRSAERRGSRRDRSGRLLLLLWGTVIIAFTGTAEILSSSTSWPVVGPLLLFFGLLSLLNAPFAWFSLGLTRALLWRGLEREKWWPYFYALLDAALAVLVISLSAIVMVIGVQTFDLMAVVGGGKQVVPLMPLLDGIASNPAAPEYWWVYALLLSTMIPSLVNLGIGGLSLTRGIPRLSGYLHGLLDSNGSVSEFHRVQIAALLGSQVVFGVALGIAAQAILVYILFRYAMPFLGVGLLEMARTIAAYGLPGRIFGLF
jgi:hypothetical protein